VPLPVRPPGPASLPARACGVCRSSKIGQDRGVQDVRHDGRPVLDVVAGTGSRSRAGPRCRPGFGAAEKRRGSHPPGLPVVILAVREGRKGGSRGRASSSSSLGLRIAHCGEEVLKLCDPSDGVGAGGVTRFTVEQRVCPLQRPSPGRQVGQPHHAPYAGNSLRKHCFLVERQTNAPATGRAPGTVRSATANCRRPSAAADSRGLLRSTSRAVMVAASLVECPRAKPTRAGPQTASRPRPRVSRAPPVSGLPCRKMRGQTDIRRQCGGPTRADPRS